MMTQEKVNLLEDKGFNWIEISEILDITYEEVRELAEKEVTEK